MNILIVEDHRFFSEALERVLAPRFRGGLGGGGVTMFAQAATVADGLRLASEEGPFDLAVIDLMLPDGDGTEVVREIKARSPGTKVAVLSADEDLSRALDAGAEEAISKSGSLDQIVATLVRLSGDSR